MNKYWVLLLVNLITTQAFAHQMKYSVLQGATSDSITHFTVVAPAFENLRFQVRIAGQPSLLSPLESARVSYPGSDSVVFRIKVSELKPNTPFVLEIVDDHGVVAESRKFKTLDLTKKGGRIAVGSCMVRQLHNPFLWNNLEKPENRPDLVMITGDAAYLDRAKLLRARIPTEGLQVWEEFVKSRQKINLYFWEELVPVLSLWDDHDSGGDNDDYSWELMPETRKIYDTFFANEEIPGFLERGPGMAKQFRLYGKNFIMLDGRSFRNASFAHPLFGDDQERWLLRKVQAGPNLLISGTQFFGGPIEKDSLEFNWPEFTKEWVEKLRQHGEYRGGAFAFVSGDVHFSEVQDLEPSLFGYWSVEITSSNIHSFGFPGHWAFKKKNPRRREVTGTHNIVLMEFSPEAEGFGFVTRAMGWRGNDLFKSVVSVSAPMAKTVEQKGCEDLLVSAPLDMKKL